MFTYINKIYNQIKNLYNIKTHINNIYKTFQNDNIDDVNNIDNLNQIKLFESLKKLIFESGSLYIKFFQWYISKLKSNTINNNTPESLHIIKFINFFEDIFE